MYYANGQEVRLGDVVKPETNDVGVVVCCMDSKEYSEGYTEVDWGYLKTGAMILFENDGLMHYPDANGLSLMSRKQNT